MPPRWARTTWWVGLSWRTFHPTRRRTPTGGSAYAVAFLAAAVRQPHVVADPDRLDWLLTCGLGARFLAQLTFDEPDCFYVRSQEDTLGAVRLALWDNRLPAAPTAVSLLAFVELEKATRAVVVPSRLPARP